MLLHIAGLLLSKKHTCLGLGRRHELNRRRAVTTKKKKKVLNIHRRHPHNQPKRDHLENDRPRNACVEVDFIPLHEIVPAFHAVIRTLLGAKNQARHDPLAVLRATTKREKFASRGTGG